MIDEIRVDTFLLRNHIDSLHFEKSLTHELAERLSRVKQMAASDVHYEDIVYIEHKAYHLCDFLSEMAESLVSVIDIFETLDADLSQMIQENLDNAQKE